MGLGAFPASRPEWLGMSIVAAAFLVTPLVEQRESRGGRVEADRVAEPAALGGVRTEHDRDAPLGGGGAAQRGYRIAVQKLYEIFELSRQAPRS